MSAQHRRPFDHVLVIMFENQYRSYVMQNRYFRGLAQRGRVLRNSFGIMHPSQTNYIASIAGELCNVTSDDAPAPLPQRTIVDLIEESPYGLTWKAYMQSYIPQNTPWSSTLQPKDEYPYVIKHNPFSSFANIQQSQARWARIQDESAFWADLLNGTLPNYAWFTPNMWNDGHYLDGTQSAPQQRAPALVDQAASWLESFFGALRFPGPSSHLPPRTLVVVTFDEADFESSYDAQNSSVYDGPNQIYTVLLGDMIEPGEEAEGYNHYSLLRTIEENFGLGSLGKNDTASNWFQFLWGRRFQWGGSTPTPVPHAHRFAIASFAGALYLVYTTKGGELCFRTSDANGWSAERKLGAAGGGPLALAATADRLVLVYETPERSLQSLTYGVDSGWSASPAPIATGVTGSLALAAFDGGQSLMLVYPTAGGALQSLIYRRGEWGGAAAVPGAATDGSLALCSLGASLYLVHKVKGQTQLAMVSYNTAPFNVVTVPTNPYGGAQDNTSRNAWSPSEFPVAHFAFRPDKATQGEPEPWLKPYVAGEPLAMAALAGVMHLVHPGSSNPLLQTETFSISGLMTPSKPVSYNSQDSASDNDGFGTLAQAGWSQQAPLHGAYCAQGGGLSMARLGDEVVLAFQPEAGGAIHVCKGGYVTGG
ncbi:MAG: alkaline phosphatase family protein [Hyalangium sp.]|uniref:alkaline phosphatase family protein n=1 Tax=Hyalangium sp. TaxID=2028555 RepID=UPI003899963D